MPVRVVLDSSVLVAALRSQLGASFRLLQELRAGRYEIALSVPLVLEYEAALLRHAEELGLAPVEVTALVDYFCSVGAAQEIHFLWRPVLRDPRDECVLELAVAAGCQAIVTHNTRDFTGADRFGVAVLTPGQFLRRLEGER
ncbi:MAG TPA: putative toxin-antitoxin system toxin component, PIN family [Candidatus Methylomirabilis sp.]|nr:putative toxin-antitoxin system toxin component, PIN family [Candidatus Methylomirabilis sp.]